MSLLLWALALLAWPGFAASVTAAQGVPGAADAQAGIALSSSVVTAGHFIAVPGRHALIDGSSSGGLEVWIYPFQILRGYRVSFRHLDETSAIDGENILSRVAYEPDAVTRIYIGTDFVVREKMMVPEDGAGAMIRYSVESKRPLEIVVHAVPVLDLMWPGALGGQSVAWNPSAGGFVLSEPLDGYTAVVGSPEMAAHDDIVNLAASSSQSAELGFTLRPDAAGKASVFVALNPAHAANPGLALASLEQAADRIVAENDAHFEEFKKNVLLIQTPDRAVNQAIAWSEIALDQAWVCNHDLGCGFVAGYGPTRPGRRPQYDWFFAGDGLVAADASLADGDWEHARDELEFILRYQNKKTGMIWHELSQSAGLIDWAGKFPYMFVHVDVTFQFLGAVGRYVQTTGDVDFARKHWDDLAAAYRYCRALIDPATGLPRIPEGKEGGNEQDRMSDDLGLSASWVAAAEAMAGLATLTGHKDVAAEAANAARKAREAIPARYWDEQHGFWISGHNPSGLPMKERRSGPSDALTLHLFSGAQRKRVLDELASAAFETDWGVRSVEAGSAGYDPESYAKGSVWPVATAELADAFWSEHRPITALSLWRALVPLSSLDSPGHMPEVLAGDFFHPQTESVPAQTWSSAGFVAATVRGLLGLESDGVTHHLSFAPRLPAAWSDVTVGHISVNGGVVSLALHRAPGQVELNIQNSGRPFSLDFAPELPLGAKLVAVSFDGKPVGGVVESDSDESFAKMAVNVPQGSSSLSMTFVGGVEVIAETAHLLLGNPGSGLHIVGTRLKGGHLVIEADVPTGRASHLQLRTPWRLSNPTGASLSQLSPGLAELVFRPDQKNTNAYRRVHVEIDVSP